MKIKILLLAVAFLPYIYTQSQIHNATINYRSPLDIPIELSAIFGELRSNHFHAGLDMRTQRAVNKKVYTIEDGYVSRINVSPWGYGLALYITHPSTGHTSVYAHLNRYANKITQYLVKEQYKQERYALDIELAPHAIPVARGEYIALSGNTGSSSGPHLHFELRDSKTEQVLDPLIYYKKILKDTTAPQIRRIAIYPKAGEGIVNNSTDVYRQKITQQKNGKYSALKTIAAWGVIGVGLNAVDKMDGVRTLYGVKLTELWCDNELIFKSNIDTYSFDQTRMLNSFIDFDYWLRNKSFYMKSFIEPGNSLSVYKESKNRGYIDIKEEKVYKLKYVLQDVFGNTSNYSFTIEGKKQTIPKNSSTTQLMKWDSDNYFDTNEFSISIPKGFLYDNANFVLQKKDKDNDNDNDNYLSDIYTLNDKYVPLSTYVNTSIKINKDTVTNKTQYGVVQINRQNNKKTWIKGKYAEGGMMNFSVRELGNSYAVLYDNESPTITPVGFHNWITKGAIQVRATDNLSGIQSYRGTIDNKYALFEYDGKSTVYTYKLDNERLEKGKNHTLVFTVSDAVGNTTIYTDDFYY